MGEQHAKGWRVSRNGLVADVTVGVIGNPMSGCDIRRLVASASAFLNAKKASMVVGLTAAAGALGVGRVLVSTDTFGVSAAALRESRRRAEADDPVEAPHQQARECHQQRRGHRLVRHWASRK
jgi:predicted polyphosphate/ATP-dependent NAD kinase